MKVVLAGGSGQLGGILSRAFRARGDDVVVISRSQSADARSVRWDGRSLGAWTKEIDGADIVVNLAGRSVNCRYTPANLRAIMSSRVDSTRAIGLAISQAQRPPRVWLQMSTATLYAHRFDRANDEVTGEIGGSEPDVPSYWAYSIEVGKAWERTLETADTPRTRKLAVRSAMVVSPDRGGVFDVLLGMTRWGLGGPIAGGRQFVSWVHERDFVRALQFMIEREELAGPINVASPNPLPQRDFMAGLRAAWGTRIGLPAARWMARIGAFFLGTDTELVLKSRRVIPTRLLEAGFHFEFPEWNAAARELVERWRAS
jgi:uncharacterized protein